MEGQATTQMHAFPIQRLLPRNYDFLHLKVLITVVQLVLRLLVKKPFADRHMSLSFGQLLMLINNNSHFILYILTKCLLTKCLLTKFLSTT
jgi:hypothetical protein